MTPILSDPTYPELHAGRDEHDRSQAGGESHGRELRGV
jgi:hypothetical protein